MRIYEAMLAARRIGVYARLHIHVTHCFARPPCLPSRYISQYHTPPGISHVMNVSSLLFPCWKRLRTQDLHSRSFCLPRAVDGLPQNSESSLNTGLLNTKGVGAEVTAPPPPVVLDEEDIEESFIRGSGPGGQKINKTASCVMLKHVPTGTVVRCQETRSRHRNRELARRILRDKLDLAIRGEHSRLAMEANKERARKAAKRRKTIKKHFKSRRDRAMLG